MAGFGKIEKNFQVIEAPSLPEMGNEITVLEPNAYEADLFLNSFSTKEEQDKTPIDYKYKCLSTTLVGVDGKPTNDVKAVQSLGRPLVSKCFDAWLELAGINGEAEEAGEDEDEGKD